MIQASDDREGGSVRFGPFSLDHIGGVLLKEGRDVPLPPKVIGVLLCLLEQPGAVVAKETLLEVVWNGTAVTDASLTEAIRKLERKPGPAGLNDIHARSAGRNDFLPAKQGRRRIAGRAERRIRRDLRK